MRKWLCICSVLILLTGCWDKVELNEISIVTGIAIEKGENAKFRVTVETINAPQLSAEQPGSGTPVITFQEEGNSLAELSERMNVGLSRKLIYSHTRIIVIDELLAKEGVGDVLDFLERTGEFRNDFNILISRGTRASDIVKTTYPLELVPSIKVHKQIEVYLEEWGGDPYVRLTDFISSLTSKGRHPVTSAVSINGKPEAGKNIEQNSKTELDSIVVISGLSVFKKDKLIGFLSREEARDYLWTQGLSGTSLTVPCYMEGNDAENNYLDIRIIHSHSDVKTTEEETGVKIKVKISGEAKIQGTQCHQNLEKIKTYENHEDALNKYIEEKILATIHKMQNEYKADIFGFGEVYFRTSPKKFKKVEDKWDETFSEAEVEVLADYRIKRSGIRNKSFLTDEPVSGQ
ncbi:MAG: Ger(x)C family spore germination protein [Bacillota bacterium]|nr:Ger(x)C family spore germination protein [Bacillota bacterium]